MTSQRHAQGLYCVTTTQPCATTERHQHAVALTGLNNHRRPSRLASHGNHAMEDHLTARAVA